MNAELFTLTLSYADIQKASPEFYIRWLFRFQFDRSDKSKEANRHDKESKNDMFILIWFSLLVKGTE